MATSVVAQGKIILANRAGMPIPEDWAIGRDGRPTSVPEEALANSVLPMAGHKGFGLAFMIDVLAGCLPGASVSPDIQEGPGAVGPQGTGHFFVAVDVDAVSREAYVRSLERLVDAVRSAPRAGWAEPFLTPGELESQAEVARAEGIPLEDDAVRLLRELGTTYDAPFFA
jgi:L-2-hydroxycarboxylate dehydrogenase (NAD+)